jgi:hypothetical protein
MPDVPPDELRRMALAVDASLEPRVRLEADLSREAAERLRDVLEAVAAEAMGAAGVEAGWPMVRLAAALDEALAD